MRKHCDECVREWVDAASLAARVYLHDSERRQLTAAILARRHLILTGPPNNGKSELARELARAITEGLPGSVCNLQGHPWWAGRTGDVCGFVGMQTNFTTWKLVYFLESVVESGEAVGATAMHGAACGYVICVDAMSPVELDLYFSELPYRLLAAREQHQAGALAGVRIIGTYDSEEPARLHPRMLRVATAVHLGLRDSRADGEQYRRYGSANASRL